MLGFGGQTELHILIPLCIIMLIYLYNIDFLYFIMSTTCYCSQDKWLEMATI